METLVLIDPPRGRAAGVKPAWATSAGTDETCWRRLAVGASGMGVSVATNNAAGTHSAESPGTESGLVMESRAIHGEARVACFR